MQEKTKKHPAEKKDGKQGLRKRNVIQDIKRLRRGTARIGSFKETHALNITNVLHKCVQCSKALKNTCITMGGVNTLLETRRKCKMTAEMMEWEDEDKLAVMQFIPSEQYLLKSCFQFGVHHSLSVTPHAYTTDLILGC